MITDTPQEKNTAPQHTPGPYGYKQARHPTDGGYDYGISAIIDGESFCIAETFAVVGEGGRKANAHENAKLFAAAPEMLAALEDITKETGHHYGSANAIKIARAAIAKATSIKEKDK